MFTKFHANITLYAIVQNKKNLECLAVISAFDISTLTSKAFSCVGSLFSWSNFKPNEGILTKK